MTKNSSRWTRVKALLQVMFAVVQATLTGTFSALDTRIVEGSAVASQGADLKGRHR